MPFPKKEAKLMKYLHTILNESLQEASCVGNRQFFALTVMIDDSFNTANFFQLSQLHHITFVQMCTQLNYHSILQRPIRQLAESAGRRFSQSTSQRRKHTSSCMAYVIYVLLIHTRVHHQSNCFNSTHCCNTQWTCYKVNTLYTPITRRLLTKKYEKRVRGY